MIPVIHRYTLYGSDNNNNNNSNNNNTINAFGFTFHKLTEAETKSPSRDLTAFRGWLQAIVGDSLYSITNCFQ